MHNDEFLAALARDGAVFGDACAAAGLDVPVAACPEWTVADLLWHLTEVHEFWRTIVGEQRSSHDGIDEPERPDDRDLHALYQAGLATTIAVLTAADPDQANWTWSKVNTAGFVVRRMAQETAVHRWDAELAAGSDVPIEARLASDGIDEFLEHFITDPKADAEPVGGSVHIHCTDVPGEWTVRQGADGAFDVAREHAKGDCALRGAASDILLALWQRHPLVSLDVVGDADVAQRFIAHTNLD